LLFVTGCSGLRANTGSVLYDMYLLAVLRSGLTAMEIKWLLLLLLWRVICSVRDVM